MMKTSRAHIGISQRVKLRATAGLILGGGSWVPSKTVLNQNLRSGRFPSFSTTITPGQRAFAGVTLPGTALLPTCSLVLVSV